jgi:hypothetical protein
MCHIPIFSLFFKNFQNRYNNQSKLRLENYKQKIIEKISVLKFIINILMWILCKIFHYLVVLFDFLINKKLLDEIFIIKK